MPPGIELKPFERFAIGESVIRLMQRERAPLAV
jgi:hypothetical protein